MVQILMTSANRKNPRRYVEILESVGAEVKVLIPPEDRPVEQLMEGVGVCKSACSTHKTT